MSNKLYQTVGLGGTFDHFHKGHEHFLQFASNLSSHLIIGITDQKLTKNKPYAHTIENFSVRQNAVKKYCQTHDISFEIVKLQDVYGPTLSDLSIQALCVTEETTQGAVMINEMRQKQKMSQLPVHVSTMLHDKTGKILSSRRVRGGEVSRSGIVYADILQSEIVLTELQRAFFAQNQGHIARKPSLADQKEDSPNLVLVVGDTTLEKFIKNKWYFSLAIYDGKEQRQPTTSQIILGLEPDMRIINKNSSLSVELFQALSHAIHENFQLLFVDGEEDLATVALVLLLPLQAKIYYGQPQEGMVEIVVNEETKNRFYEQLLA